MFKKQQSPPLIIHDTRTEYVTTTVNVTEKRAPTDESVRLLGEMERAAEQRVIESIRVGDMVFKCVVHSHADMLNDQRVLVAVFSLNGKQMKAEHRVSTRDDRSDPGAAIRGLRDEMAKVIATSVLTPALAGLRFGGG